MVVGEREDDPYVNTAKCFIYVHSQLVGVLDVMSVSLGHDCVDGQE